MKNPPETYTDHILASHVCGSAEQREQALEYIYVHSGWREAALASLRLSGASTADARDAVQEALISLDHHLRNGRYDPGRSLKNYWLGICHGQLATRQRSNRRTSYPGDPTGAAAALSPADDPETLHLKSEEKQLIRQALDRLDQRCRDLLTRYMLSFSMKEIREEFQIVSDAMTRKAAMNCRKKLFQLFEEKPVLKNYFDK